MTPTPTGITWLDALIIPAAAILALGILYRPVRAAWRGAKFAYRLAKGVEKFLRSWFGSDGQPGMVERLDAVEQAAYGLQQDMRATREEVGHVGEAVRTEMHDLIEERRQALAAHISKYHAHPEGGMS